MESSSIPSPRRTEDIALDLLKFVAGHANLGRAVSSSTGFAGGASAKPEDTVDQIFDLYARCREAVEGSAHPTK